MKRYHVFLETTMAAHYAANHPGAAPSAVGSVRRRYQNVPQMITVTVQTLGGDQYSVTVDRRRGRDGLLTALQAVDPDTFSHANAASSSYRFTVLSPEEYAAMQAGENDPLGPGRPLPPPPSLLLAQAHTGDIVLAFSDPSPRVRHRSTETVSVSWNPAMQYRVYHLEAELADSGQIVPMDVIESLRDGGFSVVSSDVPIPTNQFTELPMAATVEQAAQSIIGLQGGQRVARSLSSVAKREMAQIVMGLRGGKRSTRRKRSTLRKRKTAKRSKRSKRSKRTSRH